MAGQVRAPIWARIQQHDNPPSKLPVPVWAIDPRRTLPDRLHAADGR